MTPKRKAVRSRKRRFIAGISDYAYMVPVYIKVLARLTPTEISGATIHYLSSIYRSESLDVQACLVCMAIAASALSMRGIHTAWRTTMPASINQHARISSVGAIYDRKELLALCESAIECTWPEITA